MSSFLKEAKIPSFLILEKLIFLFLAIIMIWLTEKLEFPPHQYATSEGVLALGGDLSVQRLVLAYHNGIFPWYNENEPIVWYSPPQRMVLFPHQVKISKSMRNVLNRKNFRITKNQAFEEVIYNCSVISRKGQDGTWITNEMQQAYIELHKQGIAKSIEVWSNELDTRAPRLIGGLYGVDLKNGVFCGESMFSKESNMSKVAFIHLATKCGYSLIDCQVYNDHLSSLGAREITREDFLRFLHTSNKNKRT